MKIADIKECLERMHTIYPYKADKTDVCLDFDTVTGRKDTVSIHTVDEKSGVDIILSTKSATEIPFR